MLDAYIAQIGKDLGVPDNNSWDDANRFLRIVFSAIGRMSIAALYDEGDEGNPISIDHYKTRVEELIDSYAALYEDVQLFKEQKIQIVEDMYNLYFENGLFYHKKEFIAPTSYCNGAGKNVIFQRGITPPMKSMMSGLGYYCLNSEQNSFQSFESLFHLQGVSYSELYDDMVNEINWERIDSFPESTKYLNDTGVALSTSFWNTQPNRDGEISIAKYGIQEKMYIYYMIKDDENYQYRIPQWRLLDNSGVTTTNFGALRLYSAILYHKKHLPIIKVHYDGDIARVKLGYVLPPEEHHFFQLYSWPEMNTKSFYRNNYRGDMTRTIFKEYQPHLKMLGYVIEEI